LFAALLVALSSSAHADELGHDICFSVASETLASLSCGSMKSMTDEAIASNKDWRKELLGNITAECYPIAMDSGTWYTFRRTSGNDYSKEVVTRVKDGGLLGALVTPTKPMVCVDWKFAGFQKTIESIMMPMIAEEFFKYRDAFDVRLQELEVRTK
jgi:hypothetical protein